VLNLGTGIQLLYTIFSLALGIRSLCIDIRVLLLLRITLRKIFRMNFLSEFPLSLSNRALNVAVWRRNINLLSITARS